MMSMKLSLVPLLLSGESLPSEARRALVENRPTDAARLLMRQYELDCREAEELVGASICADGANERPSRCVRRT